MKTKPAIAIALSALSGCAQMAESSFNEAEIRSAERALEKALESSDPTAWVYAYTEDAVFIASGAPAVEGRARLMEMARAMKPLSGVSIRSVRTEGHGKLAYTYSHASWTHGQPPDAGPPTQVRGVIVWRKEADGRWRIAQEILHAEPPAASK